MYRRFDLQLVSMPFARKDRRPRLRRKLDLAAGSLLSIICGLFAMAFVLLATDASRADGYTFDTGDVLRISVFGEAAYPLEVVVDDRGSISLPLLGNIQARGLTSVASPVDVPCRAARPIVPRDGSRNGAQEIRIPRFAQGCRHNGDVAQR